MELGLYLWASSMLEKPLFLKQEIGIPMGIDPAPYWTNTFLKQEVGIPMVFMCFEI